VYWGPATLKPDATARTKENIQELVALHVDIDFKDTVETPEEVAQIVEGLSLLPTCLRNTGHGLQAFWRYRVPIPATPENITEHERLQRLLADHLAGDRAACDACHLMRLPGTTNSKNGDSIPVRELASRPDALHGREELQAWLENARPAIHRRGEGANGASPDNPFLAFAKGLGVDKAPVDVEARLAAMTYRGEGDSGIHLTQLSCSAALLKQGVPLEEVVARILEATRRAEPEGAGWNWGVEESKIRGMCRTGAEKYAPAPKIEPAVRELGEWDAGDDSAPPPPREWLLGNVFCRRFISSLYGDGGVGKTATRYAQYLSLATGKELTGEHIFQRCRVLIVSLEDDKLELQRRIRAARLHHKITLDEVRGWLFLSAPGAKVGKLMEIDEKGRLKCGTFASILETTIIQRQIDLVGLDPFIKTHAVEENSNKQIDAVAEVLTELAMKHNIAVDIPHHISKGAADPGNANRGRGASAGKDAGRLIYTLAPMSPEEANAFGIEEEQRRFFIRMDSAKVNIAPPAVRARWFELISVQLDNATESYPAGDSVQTVEPWVPPEAFADFDINLINHVLDQIDAGLPDGNRYSDTPSAKTRGAWKVIVDELPEKTEAQAREIIRTWVKNGVLVRYEYDNPKTRKSADGLRVDPSKRPT
jgi:hypothetical protein